MQDKSILIEAPANTIEISSNKLNKSLDIDSFSPTVAQCWDLYDPAPNPTRVYGFNTEIKKSIRGFQKTL